MAPVDRKNPTRAKSSESTFSYMEFAREFPNDDACLEWLWRSCHAPDGEHAYCPHCGVVRTFKRYDIGKQAWTCTSCSKRVYPTAGTIFHKSSTSLQLWFYAIWVMTSTRCGISAKQLERELGVTYKTAWRMFNLIRNRLMVQDYQGPLGGHVEADETFVGGRRREGEKRRMMAQGIDTRGPYSKKREVVFGMVERNGRVVALRVPSRYGYTLRTTLRKNVRADATIYTDDFGGYRDLRWEHRTINHTARVYVEGDTHTQTIEGFFSLVKNGIRGVYHSVSPKWIQGYLNEYAWRYNHRDDSEAMFWLLLRRTAIS